MNNVYKKLTPAAVPLLKDRPKVFGLDFTETVKP